MIKKIMYSCIFCLAVSFGVSWAQSAPAPMPMPASKPNQVTPLNRIVAIVNDEIISQSELDTAIEQFKQQIIANNLPMPGENKLRNDALDQLITYRLLLQMAARNEIKPTDAEIDQTIDQIAASHKLTIDQLKEQLGLQHIPYTDFRNKLQEQLTINKIEQQMVAGQIKVTDADITAFKHSDQGIQEYKLVDFFLPISEHPSPQELSTALATARNIQQKLNNGTDISVINPAYRDLGWRNKDSLPEIFAQQLPTLTVKNASVPLRAPNGYHVLKLVDTRNSNQQLTDDQIRQLVLRQKYEVAVKAAIAKARKQAYIQIIPQ